MQDSFQSRDQLSQLKVMPFSVEAEQALIGGLMLVDEAFDRVTGRARSDDFHRKDHALIFAAISELKERSQPADPITVAELLERKHLLEQAGGVAYLVELANNAPGAGGTGRIAQIGDVTDWNGLRIEVVDMDGHRVDRVLISRSATPPVAE